MKIQYYIWNIPFKYFCYEICVAFFSLRLFTLLRIIPFLESTNSTELEKEPALSLHCISFTFSHIIRHVVRLYDFKKVCHRTRFALNPLLVWRYSRENFKRKSPTRRHDTIICLLIYYFLIIILMLEIDLLGPNGPNFNFLLPGLKNIVSSVLASCNEK